ncbi:FliH/SctL family protein [Alphaproteobacteria bacterium]|nr:FliH/SctL family protein [Alphaproteobacteria bacterium]
MVNLAEKHDDADSVQLADAEISRILSALHHAEFKKSETQNARVDQTFKPRSLMEIAEAARQQDEAAKAAAEAAKQALEQTETAQDTAQDMAPADDLEPPMATADAPEMQPEMQPQMQPQMSPETQPQMSPEMPAVGDAGQTPTADAAEQPNPGAMAGDAAASTDIGIAADGENAAAQVTPTSPFETAQAAYDRGHAEGVTAGRTAAENELRVAIQAETEAKFADKVSAFETALMALAKPQSVDVGLLSQSMQAAVIRLAAARIGMAIDELPEIMLTRIDALAEAAGKKAAAGQVIMHPDDCAVIAPIIAARPDPLVIEANAALQRGDIRIRFDGIELDDLIDQRLTQSKPHVDASPAETPLTETPVPETPVAEAPQEPTSSGSGDSEVDK